MLGVSGWRKRLDEIGERHDLDGERRERLGRLLELLRDDPAAPTTVRDPAAAVDVHVADSLIALELEVVRTAKRVADVGAGAGFPGLPLAVALPEAQISLVESASRKCAFLERGIAAAGALNAEVACVRSPRSRSSSSMRPRSCASAARWWRGRRARRRPRSGRESPPPSIWGSERPALSRSIRIRRPSGARSTSTRRFVLRLLDFRDDREWPARGRSQAEVEGSFGNESHTTRPPRPLPSAPVGSVYAIANQKGGVGKTTTAVNVAACIAEAGYETLLIDVDPQANATVGLGLGKDLRPGIYEVLAREATLEEALRPTDVDRLALVPAGPDLAGANVELPRLPGSEARLRDALGDVRERFAFTLLDCPPSLGPLTVNALVAADRVIVPVQTEYFALEGLAGLLDTLGLIQQRLNPRLTIAGMLLTMHDGRTRLARDVEREVRQHFPSLVFDTVIPRNVRVGEAPSFGRAVIHHDPHCPGADAYFELAKEVAARG